MPLELLSSLHQVAKMHSQRGVSTVCSNKKRKFDTIDGVLGDLHPADPCEEEEIGSSSDSGRPWGTLSIRTASGAGSVVSLTSFDEGASVHPVCTGIVFYHSKSKTYVMTSLSLFRSSDNEREISYNRTTKVRLPDNQVVDGILIFHDLQFNLGVVNVFQKGGRFRAACLDHQKQLESRTQVVAVRRCFSSGTLMSTIRVLAGDPMSAYCKEDSACGTFVDFLGNIVGLNCCAEEGTTFIPRSTMLDFVPVFEKACAERRAKSADLRRKLVARWEFPVEKYKWKGSTVKLETSSPSDMSCLEGSSSMQKKQSACHYCDPEGLSAPGDRFEQLFPGHSWPDYGDGVSNEAAGNKIRSSGYPFHVLDDCGMRLLCNFEEEFAGDIWSNLTEKVASDMSQTVVALASFNGDTRYFACTGIFIDCNDLTTRVLTSASLVRNSDDEAQVDNNLKIEVCLPDDEHATGELQHCSLRYNIAIITIKGSHRSRTAQFYDQLQTEHSGKVVAVGRVYESGKLIATAGTLIDKPSELYCKELKMSTCKITKAGIGGPLIDYYGNFIGMDFYSSEGTPYLPRNVVLKVLKSFDAKWPVPKPCWCYPTWHTCMGDGVDENHLPRPM